MSQTPNEFLQHAEQVLHQIAMYEKSGATEIPSTDLQSMRKKVQSMIDSVRINKLPEKDRRYPELSRIIVDQWPLGHSLGNAISTLEREYMSL
ncbi:MAG: hypothetical protein ACRERU_19615 [Methylococcales bacterium]